METVLKVANLTKKYGTHTALGGVTFSVPKGRIVGLLGPNGSGKTTLLKLVAGVLTPTSGEISVCGEAVGTKSKALVSYLPDRTYFSKNQTIVQQMEFFQDFYADFDRNRAEKMLAILNIDPKVRLGTLSKGNQEKVQLVMVMSRRAKLYLLDEPIGGVDPAARDYILNTIIGNYDPEATVIISTHLISEVEQVLDDYLFVHKGRIFQGGSVAKAKEESGKTLDEVFREVFRCLPSC